MHQTIVILQIVVFISNTLRIDIVGDLTELAHILVTEIGVCDRVLLFVKSTGYEGKNNDTVK